jgi:hypothetical protein
MRTPEERARDLQDIRDRIAGFWAQVAEDLVEMGIASPAEAVGERMAA